MKVYVVLDEDVHCDAAVKVFEKKENALDYVKEMLKEYSNYYKHIEDLEIYDHWIYYCVLEDCFSMRVTEEELQ